MPQVKYYWVIGLVLLAVSPVWASEPVAEHAPAGNGLCTINVKDDLYGSRGINIKRIRQLINYFTQHPGAGGAAGANHGLDQAVKLWFHPNVLAKTAPETARKTVLEQIQQWKERDPVQPLMNCEDARQIARIMNDSVLKSGMSAGGPVLIRRANCMEIVLPSERWNASNSSPAKTSETRINVGPFPARRGDRAVVLEHSGYYHQEDDQLFKTSLSFSGPNYDDPSSADPKRKAVVVATYNRSEKASLNWMVTKLPSGQSEYHMVVKDFYYYVNDEQHDGTAPEKIACKGPSTSTNPVQIKNPEPGECLHLSSGHSVELPYCMAVDENTHTVDPVIKEEMLGTGDLIPNSKPNDEITDLPPKHRPAALPVSS